MGSATVALFFALLVIAALRDVRADAVEDVANLKLPEEPVHNATKGDPNAGKAVGGLGKIVWTVEKEQPQQKKDKNGAFRDLVIEKTGQRLFDSFMEKVIHPELQGYQILRDPMYLRDGMKVKKTGSLFDIDVAADHMKVFGLHQLKLTYIRVIRHFGLKDIKVNLRVGADMRIEGTYKLQGQALGFVPVTGEGDFKIDIKGFSISAITFLVLNTEDKDKDKEQQQQQQQQEHLVMRELEVTVDYKDVNFDFQNLMGGGVAGSAANLVINAMGEAIVDSQRQHIITLMKTRFKEEVSRFM